MKSAPVLNSLDGPRAKARAPVAAAALALAALAVLDGWVPMGGPSSSTRTPPPILREAFDQALRDLTARAVAFGRRPEVVRSLAGGGIAVNRLGLFSAARQSLESGPTGSWLVLTDPAGKAQAWWGDAPASLEGLPREDRCGVRWTATTATLACRRSIGTGAGAIYAARTLPALAPDFGSALGLRGEALSWEPVASSAVPDLAQEGTHPREVAFRRISEAAERNPPWPGAALAVAVVGALFLIGRARDPWRVGAAVAILMLGIEASVRPGSRVLGELSLWAGALGLLCLPRALVWRRAASRDRNLARVSSVAGYALLLPALGSATSISPPGLGSPLAGSLSDVLRLAGVAALVTGSLALVAAGRSPAASGGWMTAAILVTSVGVFAALAFVSASPVFVVSLVMLAVVALEVWSRAVAVVRQSGRFAAPRLLTGGALLTVLVVAPLAEHTRATRALALARRIVLPDPAQASPDAVFAAARAVESVSRLDLARELPAPLSRTDLSDLAYRLWRDGERSAATPGVISYRVFDSSGQFRSGFSLIPETRMGTEAGRGSVTIDRYEVALLRRTAELGAEGRPWGRVEIAVADWPAWDPLPARIDVYRRLVLGGAQTAAGPSPPRPFLAFYARDGERRDEGPALPASLRDRLRRSVRPVAVHLGFRGQELWGEIRPMPEGFRLVAVPGPDFLGRLLAAALLLPALALLAAILGAVAIWRLLTAPRLERRGVLPHGARTFRGRLVSLFVIGVMIPLLAVTLFLRSAIVTRSERDTLDHAHTALATGRQILDDYLPSVGGLKAVDDDLLSWLSNAVGYDLSVYSPESTLVATSRRDLYAAGLVPDRSPASAFVAIGLGGASQFVGSREVSGGRIDEITTSLTAIPGVPGVRSPALLSLLLLPQQRVAQAEASELTAAVSAFSLLAFLFSALIAGRLAVRVARPVADLAEATRAVARGDFSPRLPEPPDEELRELVTAFLSMSQSLQRQTAALSAEKERLATLLAHLTAGVVAYRESGEVLLANPAAVALGQGQADGESLAEVFPGETMKEVRGLLSDVSVSFTPVEVEPRPGERWRLVTVPLPLGGEGARLAVIEDVSDVVRSNRLAAWAEMARIIAHEIKNPLTPIRLSVEHLREVWRRGSPEFERVLEECVTNVLRQTEELRRSASEFSDYARLPIPQVDETDISGLLSQSAAAYAGAPGVRWTVRAEPELIALADSRLLSRVFSNLVGNAVEALAGAAGEIRLTARRVDSRIVVTIEDQGPGVSPALLPRLFDPYFSAKSGGTGLGLAIAKKIIEEHGGTISAENRSEGGFRVTFDLPLAQRLARVDS